MKKLNNDLYLYKGLEINKVNDIYELKVLVKGHRLPWTLNSPTLKGIKSVIDNCIAENGEIRNA